MEMGKWSTVNNSFFPFSFRNICFISFYCSFRTFTITFFTRRFISLRYSSRLRGLSVDPGVFHHLGQSYSFFGVRVKHFFDEVWIREGLPLKSEEGPALPEKISQNFFFSKLASLL